ncbi:MAG TPA: DedA family protein [Candidatus Saccharimonadales bacterium]|nr:DedA family protein [Candidatus Saccharimonadales bacterium]
MFNVTHLIEVGGLFLIGGFVFAESGMMVGLFLPGDTLLLSAGVLAATGKLSITSVIIVIALAAILGDNAGFFIGKHLGPRLFRKKDGIIFRKQYIEQAEKFYEKYGARAMLVEHFVPLIRSFAPVTAGAGKMNYGLFFICNAIGDIAWAVSFTLFGYYIASKIPHIDKYIEPAILAVVIIFALPTVYRLTTDPKIRAAVRRKLSRKPQKNDQE